MSILKKYCTKSIDIWDKRGYNLDKKRTGGAKNEDVGKYQIHER